GSRPRRYRKPKCYGATTPSEARPHPEVELPAGLRQLVEAVRVIQSDRAERRYDLQPELGAPEHAGGVDVAGIPPHVPGVVEEAHADLPTEPDGVFRRDAEEGVTQPVDVGHALRALREEAERRAGRLRIPAQVLAALDAAQPEAIEREGVGVAEHRAAPEREAQRQTDAAPGRLIAADTPRRNPPRTVREQPRELAVPAQEAAVQLHVHVLPRPDRREERVVERLSGDAERQLALHARREPEERRVLHVAEQLVLRARDPVSDKDPGAPRIRPR